MTLLCLTLIMVALAISLPATAIVRTISRRMNAFDAAGVQGQVKDAPRRIPNTGGIAIYLALVLPILAGLAFIWFAGEVSLPAPFSRLADHAPGIRAQTPLALLLIACLTLLHIMGLIDDRRPLGPFSKLLVMLAPALAIVVFSDTRLLTMLDARVGGPWLSILLTVLWIVVVTNAMNFIDNMDGLAAGVAAIASACFLTATLIQGQWFVAACLALLIGALLGFLFFNSPPATIFMGDGGSLIVGFMLAFLTVRTTYINPAGPALAAPANWYGVLMPFIILAVPIYDFISVSAIRISQGRSPFVGDLQHLSHRLVRRGLSKPLAVVVICGFTAATGLSGVFLGQLSPPQALIVGVQTVLLLIVLGVFEFGSDRAQVPTQGSPE